MEDLKKIFDDFQADGNGDAMKARIMHFFDIPHVADMAMDFLVSDQDTSGYFHVRKFKLSFYDTLSYKEITGRFDDSPFPALSLGHDGFGNEFWMMLETGKVISLNTDYTFLEKSSSIKADTKEAFCIGFAKVGSFMDVNQLIQINIISRELEEEDEESQKKFFIAVAKLFGKVPEEFMEIMLSNPALEFIETAVRSYLEFLEENEGHAS